MGDKLDQALFDIRRQLWTRVTTTEAERAITPLVWYINTGRAPTEFVWALCHAAPGQKATIANRLLKHAGTTYDAAILVSNGTCNKPSQPSQPPLSERSKCRNG